MSDSTPSTEQAERRRHPRVQALYYVVIAADGAAREVGVAVGRTLDVSESGVRLETPGHLCVDDRVRLEIAVEERLIDARGRVVRAMRAGDLLEAGIEFTAIDEEDRIALVRG